MCLELRDIKERIPHGDITLSRDGPVFFALLDRRADHCVAKPETGRRKLGRDTTVNRGVIPLIRANCIANQMGQPVVIRDLLDLVFHDGTCRLKNLLIIPIGVNGRNLVGPMIVLHGKEIVERGQTSVLIGPHIT